MLWVYGHYKYFGSFSAGIVFIRQNLTYKDDPRTERVKKYITFGYKLLQTCYEIAVITFCHTRVLWDRGVLLGKPEIIHVCMLSAGQAYANISPVSTPHTIPGFTFTVVDEFRRFLS